MLIDIVSRVGSANFLPNKSGVEIDSRSVRMSPASTTDQNALYAGISAQAQGGASTVLAASKGGLAKFQEFLNSPEFQELFEGDSDHNDANNGASTSLISSNGETEPAFQLSIKQLSMFAGQDLSGRFGNVENVEVNRKQLSQLINGRAELANQKFELQHLEHEISQLAQPNADGELNMIKAKLGLVERASLDSPAQWGTYDVYEQFFSSASLGDQGIENDILKQNLKFQQTKLLSVVQARADTMMSLIDSLFSNRK